jgi:competence protein ComEA
MPARYWLAAGAVVLAMVAASIWYGESAAEPVELEIPDSGRSDPTIITVHIAGEVVAPGLVLVSSDARVADAVAAAGGSTRRADLSRVNLAAPLHDGEQIVIPSPNADAGDATVTDGRVRINDASVGELEQLPGVGPVLAGRIAAYRDENGPFSAVEDLLDVPGIGEGKLATLRDAVALP